MSWQLPDYLYLLLCTPLIVVGLWLSFRASAKRRACFAREEAVTRLFIRSGWGLSALLLCSAYALMVMALARPQWGYRWEKIQRQGIDIVVVLDTSKSMLATDVKPNRLARAKREIVDLLALLEGDRISLIPFAGAAHTLFPLTHDYAAARLFINDITHTMIPRGGTNIATAIETGLSSFENGGGEHRAMIVITDGESHEGDIAKVIANAKEAGVHIYTIGIGTVEGSRIEIVEQGRSTFLKDAKGNIAFSKLDDTTLRSIANQTGAAYVQASAGALGLEELYRRHIEPMEPKEMEEQRSKRHFQRFQYPLAAAALLLAILFAYNLRRGALLLFLLLPLSAYGDVYDDIERGQKLLDKDPQAAVEAFTAAQIELPEHKELHYNLGVAQYRAGEFENAAKSFSTLVGDEALGQRARYNLGNSALMQKRYEEAIAQYEELLKKDPQHEDAQFNLDYARKELEKQKQDQQQKDDQKQQDDKQDQDKQKQDQKRQNQQGDKEEQQKQQGEQDQKDKQESDSSENQQDQQQKDEQEQQGGEPQEGGDEAQQKEGQAEESSATLSEKELEKMMREAQQREKNTRRKLYMQVPDSGDAQRVEKDW